MTAQLRRSIWPAALLAMLVIAGCSPAQQGTTVGDNDGGGDAGGVVTGAGGALCSILTEEDISQIAGADVTASELTEDDCDFTIDETSLINVRYESAFDPGLETARMICDDAEDVEVGDDAIWCPGISVLYFNKGDRSVAVQLVFLTDDAPSEEREIAEEIARRIADGL